MGYERVEVTGKPVGKWWGGWRYKVDILIGLDKYDEALRESVELTPKKYTLRGAEAEIVSGAMGRLIPADTTLEIVTLDTDGNRDKIGRLVEKVAKNPKVRAQYSDDFADRLGEQVKEAVGIVRRSY